MKIIDFRLAKVRTGGGEDKGDMVICYSQVESDNGEKEYTVVKYSDGDYRCTCPGHMFHRNKPCKHIVLFARYEKSMAMSNTKESFWKSEWCKCEFRDSSTQPVYFEDHVCGCGVNKHHYHCKHCGCLKQVG